MATQIQGSRRVAMAASLLAMSVGCSKRPGSPPNAEGGASHLMTPTELNALPRQPPDHRIEYGADSSQYGELRLPTGAGLHPLVILIHGGCFKAAYATAQYFGAMADALKAEGIATWNIEYRRLGETGSGWPGTYLDVGQAVDRVRAIAPEYGLDLGRVVVVGHSSRRTLDDVDGSALSAPKGE